LFAAFLAAFLIYTIAQLQPNSADISKDILLHISLQLNNSSVPAFVEPEFSVPPYMAAVNVLLFGSLALVLIDAYLAILTKTWLREFDRSWRSVNVPDERAKAREMRLQGLEQWRLAEVVALLPLLIQVALVLFCAALLIMLFNLHYPTACLASVIFAAGLCFDLSTTVVSVFDPNSPFTSPTSRALQALIRQSRLREASSAILSCLKWRPGATKRMRMDDERVNRYRTEGTEPYFAISNRLYAATSKGVDNLPVLMALFDQWLHMPSLSPPSVLELCHVLRPCLSNVSLCEEFGLRSVARLFLCFNVSKEFHKTRQTVIDALEKHVGETEELPSIEQLYIHLLDQPQPDWPLACKVVANLKSDRDTIIELRWILNWITFRFLVASQEFPNEHNGSWIPSILPFLQSTTVYIIQNRLADDDLGLFNSILVITQSIAARFKEMDESNLSAKLRESQTSIGEGQFVSIDGALVPPKSQWEFIGDLYAARPTSGDRPNGDFTLLVIFLMIRTLSMVKFSAKTTYNRFISPEKDLPVLMDALWEIWKTRGVDHQLLVEIAAGLLQPSNSFVLSSDAQQSFQDLLLAYDTYTSGTIPSMTPSALSFIGEALSFSHEAAKSAWEPRTSWIKSPWLLLHIYNIIRRDWRIAEDEEKEEVWGHHDRHDSLDSLDRHDLSDWVRMHEWRNSSGRLDLVSSHRRSWSNWPDLRNQLDLQCSSVLEMIAKPRLDLYNTNVLHPDPVALSLFLSQRNEDIFNDSRRLTLEFFRSPPSAFSIPPHRAHVLCSDFFDSRVIGDLTKWRLLASVVFPEWETLSTQWKDLLAAEVMKVEWVGSSRVDWMARVTPLLEGEFNLYEFGLANDDPTHGPLTPTHLRMVATVVEYWGVGRLRLTDTERELERFLDEHSNILSDEEALRRIRTVH
jgi:hypothetical protein